MRHVFVDYSNQVLDENKIKEMMANGIEAVIMRSGYVTSIDPAVALQVPILRKCGMPFGFYRYWVTGYSEDYQANALLKDGLDYNPACTVGDEEDRHNYFTWATALPEDISTSYHLMATQVDAKTARPYLNYGGRWFCEAWSPPMVDWIKSQWFWGAEYPHGWDQHTPELWPKTYKDLMAKLHALTFPIDPLYPTWAAWQCGGNMRVAEIDRLLDFSVVDRDDVWAWMFLGGPMPAIPGYIPPVPVETLPYYVSNETGLYVRSAPDAGAAKLRWLADKTPLAVVKILQGWATVAQPLFGYVNAQYIKPVVK
jgi:hypothetical protein